jgi:hypothetical protein
MRHPSKVRPVLPQTGYTQNHREDWKHFS